MDGARDFDGVVIGVVRPDRLEAAAMVGRYERQQTAQAIYEAAIRQLREERQNQSQLGDIETCDTCGYANYSERPLKYHAAWCVNGPMTAHVAPQAANDAPAEPVGSQAEIAPLKSS